MSEQGDVEIVNPKKFNIEFLINEEDKSIEYIIYNIDINGNPESYKQGVFITANGKSGDFTYNLDQFIQNKPEFLTIYQGYSQAKPQEKKGLWFGGKKTKSTRSYNANKTLKNRK